MSDIVTFNFTIKNMEALKKTAIDRNLLFLEGETKAKWFANLTFPCSHIIRHPEESNHDIGVCEATDGFNLRYDKDSAILRETVPSICQGYQRNVIEMELPEGCYIESEEYDSEGNIQLILAEN